MKKIFAILFAVVLVFTAAACETGVETESSPTVIPTESPSALPTEAPAATPTEKPFVLEDYLKTYPALLNVDGYNNFGYYTSIDDLTTARVFMWAIEHVDPCNFADDNGGYSYSYKITALDAFTEKYLGRTYDYLPITNEDLVLDPESDTLTITYHGAYGDMPIRAIYESYTQVDDTHFTVTYHTGESTYENNQMAYFKVSKTISVELVDGNYIMTAHQESARTEISVDDFYAVYVN
ncbi:MAG: PT domain-containing protein [Clostridia bacterium]|nr:PT domain-containing protein [Clostridia bacterium]